MLSMRVSTRRYINACFCPRKGIRITHGPAQNAADHISGFRISEGSWESAIEKAIVRTWSAITRIATSVVSAPYLLIGELGYFVDQRSEYVGIVV